MTGAETSLAAGTGCEPMLPVPYRVAERVPTALCERAIRNHDPHLLRRALPDPYRAAPLT